MIRINKLVVLVKKALRFNDRHCRHNKCYCGFYCCETKSCVLFDQDLDTEILTSGNEPNSMIPLRYDGCKTLFGKDESNILIDLINEM